MLKSFPGQVEFPLNAASGLDGACLDRGEHGHDWGVSLDWVGPRLSIGGHAGLEY